MPHSLLLESITPRAVSGGSRLQALQPMQIEEPVASDELSAQAYRQGYGEGFEAGEQDGRREAEQFQQAWEDDTRQRMEEQSQALAGEREALAAFASGLQQQWLLQCEEMEQLAFELALQALSQTFGVMQGDRESLRRLCQQLAQAYRGKAIRLEVATTDRSHLPEQFEGLDIAIEHALSPGECRIVTARGYAETSIATRLDAIYQSMLQALGIASI
ncbi:hypothetical protein ISP15_17540 [Dyella jejuensis]|uniref:Flagellar assembly protein FliH n=1 Tax=Dyella jejuensis TaxID=1432009 RepID=A0ABW8JM00_9GAMM